MRVTLDDLHDLLRALVLAEVVTSGWHLPDGYPATRKGDEPVVGTPADFSYVFCGGPMDEHRDHCPWMELCEVLREVRGSVIVKLA